MRIVVAPHDSDWRLKYEAEAKTIKEALGPVVSQIHHIGSTAVPGIYAKPVIDILIEATAVEALDERSERLVALGYEAMGEFGIPRRRYFRKDGPSGVREYQVHAFAAQSDEVRRHLAFRDFLRSHPDEAQEYSDLKRRLARDHPFDMGAYMDGKDPFIRAVEQAALQWRMGAKESS